MTSYADRLAIATSRLTDYLAAEKAITTGAQEYTVGQGTTARRLVRADLEQVRGAIKVLQDEVAFLSTAASRARRIVYIR
jgi:hypothetical protein